MIYSAELLKGKGYYYAFLAALLFGASTPISKYLLNEINSWLLAGLIYLGSAFGLIMIFFFRRYALNIKINSTLRPENRKWMAGSALLGGIISPILLLSGLSKASATVTSLLLNFENIFTVVLAWLIFKEKIDRYTAYAILFLILGSLTLAWADNINFNNSLGMLLIISACFLWALENNMVKKIAMEDPVILALIKSSVAGITNITIGIMLGGTMPPKLRIIMGASMVGIICYAFSMLFYILALRYVGAARTGAYSSFAPFIGACLSVLFLKENLSIQLIIAGILMSCGIAFHFFKSHSEVTS